MKKCAFCTRPADSPEHIFSDWMIELLPPDQRYVCNERIVSRDEYIQYQRRKIKFVAKAVCTPCNNGWMSDLEGALKSVIGDVLAGNWGAIKIFTPEQLKIIAAFAFKTLVLVKQGPGRESSVFHPSSAIPFSSPACHSRWRQCFCGRPRAHCR
jgi:hypothetical protein